MDGCRQQGKRSSKIIQTRHLRATISNISEREPLLEAVHCLPSSPTSASTTTKVNILSSAQKAKKTSVEKRIRESRSNGFLRRSEAGNRSTGCCKEKIAGSGCRKGSTAAAESDQPVYGSMPTVRKDSFRWLLPRAPQRRLVYKNGECNITRANINKRGQRYLADIFTTLVDIKWRWNLLIFALAFTLSWIIFGLVWWLICFSHGDLDNYGQPGWKACVENVHDFPTALLFSIETQQTIGYGLRCMNPYCIEAIAMVMFQSCFGIIIQALMTGLVFAKLSRPKKRAQTLMFSKSAVVCERDGELCLLFRVGDMRKSHIVEAQIRAVFVSKRVTKEGEVMPLFQRDLLLGDGTGDGRLFLVWPIIVEHKINRHSPLWDMSADDLHRRHFEIIIILEGIVESTGMTTQARTSYLSTEVLWGQRFERLVSYQRENGQYLVDYSRFNNIAPIEMSAASAKERAASSTAGCRRPDDDDTDEDENENGGDGVAADVYPSSSSTTEVIQCESVLGSRPRRTDSVSSRLNGVSSAALAAFDLQNEFGPSALVVASTMVAGIDNFTAQIDDVGLCPFNPSGVN